MTRGTPPRDSLDLPALRDGSRREIPWDAELPPIDDRRRDKLVFAWTWRREQEHHAVAAFSRLAADAARFGCEPATLALLTRAATDEVHHADVCRRVVEKHTGREHPTTLVGGPALAPASSAEDVLFAVVETCCISETMTGAYFTEMLETATHPLARAVVLSLLEDEIDHGRVGWAYLAAARRDGIAGGLAAALPRLLDRTVAEVFDDARKAPEGDDPLLDQHGYIGLTRGARIYKEALEKVVLPGFEALEIDTRAARAHIDHSGWL
ncbi:MAG: ferritin-like domain-containing protein [Polyangiaceae bacterium]|nr:ferritin-like domain-containing protein [Polyangiaceae bacterium]